MINAAKNKRPSEVEEWWGACIARSSSLVISLKDGSRILVGPSFKVISSGNSTTCMPYGDRVIIYRYNTKITVDSTELAVYLKNQARKDMPLVPLAVADEISYAPGQTITIYGDGCFRPKVKIYLQNAVGILGSEKYLIAEVPTVLGKWKWSGSIGREFTTVEGTGIRLHKGSYNFYVVAGDSGDLVTTIQRSFSTTTEFKVGPATFEREKKGS